jgi:FixJ family two-component response regulator
MEHRLIIHVVDSDSRSRAEQARTAFALGHHAEVYSDLAELMARMPPSGIILLRERATDVILLERFGERGLWLPVIICAEEPHIERVVSAIKGGALDYLQLPLEAGRLARSLARVAAEASARNLAHLRLADARRRIARLSKREREVLELLALGTSNKLIARELEISPRTVEVHRSNMMTKLRAGHAAEAVRLWLQSGLETKVPAPPRDYDLDEGGGLSLNPELARLLRSNPPERAEEERDDSEDAAGKQAAELAPGQFRVTQSARACLSGPSGARLDGPPG